MRASFHGAPVSFCALLASVLLLPFAVHAETVILRNGKYEVGELLGQNATTLTLRTATGVKVIEKSKVRRVLYTTTSDEEKTRLEDQARADQERRAREQQARERALKERQEREAAEKAQAEAARKKAAEEARRKRESEAGFLESKFGRAFFRSAVLPGWGQLFQERELPGTLFRAFGIGTGVLAYLYAQDYEPKRKTYESESSLLLGAALLSPDSLVAPLAGVAYQRTAQSREAMQLSGRRANFFWSAFALVWTLNMVDVVIFRPSDGAAIFLSPSEGMQIGFRLVY